MIFFVFLSVSPEVLPGYLGSYFLYTSRNLLLVISLQRVMRRCREKAREYMTSDRLMEDKNYLTSLASGIGNRPDLDDDKVEKEITDTAEQVLNFLKLREEFWSQIDVGKKRERQRIMNRDQQNND